MRVGVISNDMPPRCYFCCQTWVFADVLAQNKECSRDFVFVQQRQKTWGHLRIGPVIESQSAVGTCIPYDWSKQS